MTWTELQAEPAFGFTVVGLIIVFGPLIAARLRLPGLLGLLVFGAVVGPNVLDLLPTFATLRSIGDIGVLYLIFLSGLQLNLDSFAKHWRISAGFGALTSLFPLVLGTLAALAAGIDLTPSILIGSFWASFTLIAYPVISRYALTKNRAVAATVGASSITDTVSLVILAVIIGKETGDAGGVQLVLELGVGFVVLGAYSLLFVPFVANWFFVGLGQERTLRFILVLVAMTSSALVAEVMGIEALIGAFFAGVGLNRLVPNASPLMAVTEFFGNAFFIPAFMVSVGLLFDPQLMFQWTTIRLALLFTGALLVGKSLAALITGQLFRLETAETGLMFSVSVAQAAATLAAAIVGLQAGLFGDDVLNAVMVVVSVSLFVTSVGSERFAPRVEPPATDSHAIGEAIMIPIADSPADLETQFRFAGRLATESGGVLQPLVVLTSTATDELDEGRALCRESDDLLRRLGGDVETVMRIDRSIATGIHRASIESDSSLLYIPWPEVGGLRSRLLGGGYSEIVAMSSIPTVIAGIQDEPFDRIVVLARPSDLLPGNVPTLLVALELAARLAGRGDATVVGPVGRDQIEGAGIVLPDDMYDFRPSDKATSWLRETATSSDLVIAPIDEQINASLITLFEAGVSVVAVGYNQASQSTLSGGNLTFPVGGTLNPS